MAITIAVGGCGGSSASPVVSGDTLSALCAQTTARLTAIAHRRIVSRGGSNVIVPSKKASERQKDVEAALSEDSAVYAAAIPAVERLRPATAAGSAALAHLEESGRRVATLRAELARGGEAPLTLLFAASEAEGGCRKIRAAIGG